MITASCYEHHPVIGHSAERMRDFSDELTKVFTNVGDTIHAWTVLPNHYHVLLTTADLSRTLQEAGKFHGRTSFRWNGEEECRGR
ncbi:MAG: hypothetical protein ACAI34_20020, partial [Verrucomicrobium sp.]